MVHGGTPANKNLSAPENAEVFYLSLSSLPDWANKESDPFRKISVLTRSPEKKADCEGRQPNASPAGEESGSKASEKEKTDVLKQLIDLVLKARELRNLMKGKRSITNPMRDIHHTTLKATLVFW